MTDLGLRDGMSVEEMVARFARLNDLDVADASAQFEELAAERPILRAETIGSKMDGAAQSDNHSAASYYDDVFLADWLESYDLIRHNRDVYQSTKAAHFGNQRLFRYVATMLRLRKKTDLVELHRGMIQVEASMGESPDGSGSSFDTLFDRVRPFAAPEHPANLAGVTMAPRLTWNWEPMEAVVDFLRGLGLSVRIGLAEDQWYTAGTLPVVIWNPDMVTVKRIEPLAYRFTPGTASVEPAATEMAA